MLDLNYVYKLRDFIDANPCIDFDSRVALLYPLLDQIYSSGDRLSLTLENGLRLDYLYKSNIAKEILLRERENPSHAWEPMTTRVVELAIRYRPGPVLIGGAYFGDHAMIAAKELQDGKHAGPVICVEPNEEQGQLLLENAAINGLSPWLRLVKSVLWDREGLRFNLNDQDSHASVELDDSAACLSETIDHIVSDQLSEGISLLMLDIEGSEEKALAGARSVLSLAADRAPVIIVEIHRKYVDWDCGLSNTEMVRFLVGYGYHVYALRDCQSNWELGLEAPEIIPLEDVYLSGPPHGFNLIASKDEHFFDASGFKRVSNVSPKYLRHRDAKLHAPMP
jgi:FkbM family methyltransferase